MKTRNNGGGTLGIAAVLMLALIFIGFAAFILYRKEGGFRQIQTAAGCGSRNVAHNAQVHSIGGLNTANPIDRAISEVVSQRGRVSLVDGPVLESWELLAAMNAAADGADAAKANVRALMARIHGLARTSVYSQLRGTLERFGTTNEGKSLFESVARRNPTGMINDPNSQPMTQTDYRVGYSENRTNIDLGNPAVLEQQRPYTTAGYFTGERQPWPGNMSVSHGGRNWLGAYRAMVVGAAADNLTVAGPALPFGQSHNVSLQAANPAQPVPIATLPPNTFVNTGMVPDPHGGPAAETAAAVACSVLRKPNAIEKGFIIYDNSTPAITASAIKPASYIPTWINPTPEFYAIGDIGRDRNSGAFTFPTFAWLMDMYMQPGQDPDSLPSIVQDIAWWGGPDTVMFDGTGRKFTSNRQAYEYINHSGQPAIRCADVNGDSPDCSPLMEPQGAGGELSPPAQVAFFEGGGDPGPWPNYQLHSHSVSNTDAVSYMDSIILSMLGVGDLYARYERPNEGATYGISWDDQLVTGSLAYPADANPRTGGISPFKGDGWGGYFGQVPELPQHVGKRDYEVVDASNTNITTLAQQIEAGPYTVLAGGRRDTESVSRKLVDGRPITIGVSPYPVVNGVLDRGFSGGAAVASPRPPSQVIPELLFQRCCEIDPSFTRGDLTGLIASMTGMGKWWIDKRNGRTIAAYRTATPWSAGDEPLDGTPMTFRTNDFEVDANPYQQLRIHDNLFVARSLTGAVVGQQTMTAVPCSGFRLLLASITAKTAVWTANPRPIGWPPNDPPRPRIVPVIYSDRN